MNETNKYLVATIPDEPEVRPQYFSGQDEWLTILFIHDWRQATVMTEPQAVQLAQDLETMFSLRRKKFQAVCVDDLTQGQGEQVAPTINIKDVPIRDLVARLNYCLANPLKYRVFIYSGAANHKFMDLEHYITEHIEKHQESQPYWTIDKPPATPYNENELRDLMAEDVIVVPMDNLFAWWAIKTN